MQPPHCSYLIANNLLLKLLQHIHCEWHFLCDLTWLVSPSLTFSVSVSHPFGSSQVTPCTQFRSIIPSSPPRSTIRFLIIFLPRNYRPNPPSSSSISCSSACRRLRYYNRISVSVDQVNSSSISRRNCCIVGHYNNYSVVLFSSRLPSSGGFVSSWQQ